MLQDLDKSKLDGAYMDALGMETEAVVVAIARNNGRKVVYNIGDDESRNALYNSMATYALFRHDCRRAGHSSRRGCADSANKGGKK